MITISFCYRCEKKLRGNGNYIFEMYYNICKNYMLYNRYPQILDYHNTTTSSLQLMERKGFIITTECCNDQIIIKPVGIHALTDEHYHFCAESALHEKGID